MRKIYYLPLFGLLCLLLFECGQVKIITEYDKKTEFPDYKTYMFMPWIEINSDWIDDIDKGMFYKAIASELNARGYKKVKADADLAVNLMVIIDKGGGYSGQIGHYNTGLYGYYSPFGVTYRGVQYQTVDNLTGTLVIDIVDNKKKHLLYQGAAIGEVKEQSNKREKKIKKVISRIFVPYPVRKKKHSD